MPPGLSLDLPSLPKPPPTLERYAELGDDIIQTGVNDTIRLRATREVSQPPHVWNYILKNKSKNTVHSSVVKLAAPQAKSLEISLDWCLRSCNYIF